MDHVLKVSLNVIEMKNLEGSGDAASSHIFHISNYLLNFGAHCFPPATYLEKFVRVVGSSVPEALVVDQDDFELL